MDLVSLIDRSWIGAPYVEWIAPLAAAEELAEEP
jgi:hypothetical protein